MIEKIAAAIEASVRPLYPACKYCGKLAAVLCAWPVQKRKYVVVSELKIGDQVVRVLSLRPKKFSLAGNATFASQSPTEEIRQIVDITPAKINPGLIAIWLGGMTSPYVALPRERLRVMIPGTCDAPCCDNHCREVSDSRHYCQEHAKLQETLS